MSKKSWMGNRLMWHPTQTSAGSRGRATNVLYRRERIPWLLSDKLITAFICHEDFSLKLYDTPRLDNLTTDKCFLKVESYSLSISELAEFLPWPASEAVFTEFSGRKLSDIYPSSLFVEQLTNRWLTLKMPEWYIVDRSPVGVSFVSQVNDLNSSCTHAIELTDNSFAVYRHDLLRSSAFAERDQILKLKTEHLDIDRMLSVMQPDDVVTVRYVARLIRRLHWHFAVEYESV